MLEPFYDPKKTYEENLKDGPFGAFADGKVLENEGEPKYDFLGTKIYSPFGIPAGPLVNGKFCKAALLKGFDIVVYKTVRTVKQLAHPWPNVLAVNVGGRNVTPGDKLTILEKYEAPLSITNSFGVPSAEPKFWQEDIKNLLTETKKGQVIVGAFQGTKNLNGDFEAFALDFALAARMLKESGVKVFEVNLSCPNEGTGKLLCYDTEGSEKVINRIKEEIGNLPLIIKIGYFENDEALADFVKKAGAQVQGISAINTIPAEILDEKGEQALPGSGRLRSGVCGEAIKWAGITMVQKLKKLREELGYTYIIIGVGGVFNFQDFKEYQKAGADIVMSATGSMWNPHLAEEIKKNL